jgi:hypothetical protein
MVEQPAKGLVWMAFAGLSGSFVGMRLRKKKAHTLSDNAQYMLSGLLVAFFITPMVCKWFHVTDPEDIRAITFITGVFWPKILERFRQDIKSKTFLSGGDSK